VVFLRNNLCLPYIMRDTACSDDSWEYKQFILELYYYCNFAGYFYAHKFDEMKAKKFTEKSRQIWRENQ